VMNDPPVGPTVPYQPTPRTPAERFAPGALLAGRYRVVSALGKGGMGEVYRADDLTLGQPVALKFLPAALVNDPDRLARFRGEVAAARRVSHPNVCRVYDIAGHDGQPFLTMEFIDGEDLSSVLTRLGRMTEEKGAEVARQLCAALAAVHDQGLLHRDLKPANVMLDGRGKVRLTDFGLAAGADGPTPHDVRSGTPLYQAPEQLAGREVTVRSDLYALGLVLYELFTGKRAFADTKRDSSPSKPSSHVSTLDPAVERVILRCLETDPAARPRSAMEVLAGLPGGDPLAAALAAGETPSPQMVAAAPLEGALRPAVAAAMFVAVVVLLLVIAGLNDRYKAHRHVPLPPPAVLDDRARALVRALGYPDPPADTFGGFEMPPEHQSYMARHDGQAAVPLDQMASCRPPLAVYYHRQSQRPLVPIRVNDEPIRLDRLTARNPPTTRPGMLTLWMDTRGRLVGFLAVPDPERPPGRIDWDAVLKLAELDGPGVLRPDPDATPTPPVFADQTAVWTGAYPERPELAVRVEAAAHRGRLVYFRLTHPDWGEPPADRPVPIVNRGSTFFAALEAAQGVMLAGILFFAVWNVRRGRADLHGAVLLGVAVALFQGLFWLLAAGHFPHWGVLFPLALNEFAMLVNLGVIMFASYLALEPVLRRRCPHRLTSWLRLSEGRWLDPLVGRHVLIGVLAGVVCSLNNPALPFWPSRWGPSVVPSYSFTSPAGELAGTAVLAVGVVWMYAGVFAILLAASRREWLATGVIVAYFLLSIAGSGFPLLHQGVMVVRGLVGLGLFLRLGILAAVACQFTGVVITSGPLTLDPSAWYFGSSLTYFAALIGLAGYGFYASTGGAKWFKEGLFGED
jgi:hypothetical protein